VENSYQIEELPRNVEAEQSVIASVLIDPKTIEDIPEIDPEMFYQENNKIIYKAMLLLSKQNLDINIVTVSDQLGKSKELELIGGSFTLVSIMESMPTSKHIKSYADLLHEAYQKRKYIDINRSGISKCFLGSEELPSIIDTQQSELVSLSNSGCKVAYYKAETVLDSVLTKLEEACDNGGTVGVKTGFKHIDYLLGGLKPQQLIIIAARPSMGKTALALNMMRNMAMNDVPVGYFSLEMSKDELVGRLMCTDSGVEGRKMEQGRVNEIEWKNITRSTGHISQLGIYINDEAGITLGSMKAKARKMIHDNKVEVLIVDYLGLMKVSKHFKGSRYEVVSEIVRELKNLAKDLDIPVIALSQLSRNLESRTDRRPIMSDLRESGEIEQAADVIMMIYRDSVYNDGASENSAEVRIAKHRNGACGTVHLHWRPEVTRFTDTGQSR